MLRLSQVYSLSYDPIAIIERNIYLEQLAKQDPIVGRGEDKPFRAHRNTFWPDDHIMNFECPICGARPRKKCRDLNGKATFCHEDRYQAEVRMPEGFYANVK